MVYSSVPPISEKLGKLHYPLKFGLENVLNLPAGTADPRQKYIIIGTSLITSINPGLAWYISLIYIGYISDIFVRKYQIFSIFSIFIEFFFISFLMWHIVTLFWFSVRVFCWLMTCALSIFSVLDNFCQIARLHSNTVWMTRVRHLICKAHTHTIIW